MAHVEDMWTDRKGEKRSRYGIGRRWRVRWTDPGGTERSRSFIRKGDADRFRAATEIDMERGNYTDPAAGKITLKRYASTWLAAQTFSESSRETVESRLRLHICPGLGDRPVSQLTPSVVQAWLRGLDVAPSHAGLILSVLSSVLNSAVDDGLIARNPCHARSVKAPPAEERKIRPWTAQQVAAIRAAMPERYRVMADLGAGLGLRQGEVLGLAAGDVDFLRRVVHVRRQVKIIGGRMLFGPTKNKKEREVPLPDEVGLRLGAHIAAYPPVAVTLPWHTPGARPVAAELLFTTPSGGAVNRHTWNSAAWRPAVAAAGMPAGSGTGFHQLRHHFASSLLAGQVDIRALATYLGHHDPGFTLRVYTHLMPDTADRMRRAVDTALRGDVTTPARVAGNA